MHIKILENYRTSENTYLVYENGNGFVVDPSYKADGILKAAADEGVTITHILLTHSHYDHVETLEELIEKTNAKLVCGNNCSINVCDPQVSLTRIHGLDKITAKTDIIVSDNEQIHMPTMTVTCVYTPGHTNCSVCYVCDDHIFSGDTLFWQNVGRADLPTGDFDALKKSISEKLYILPDDFVVHPGHGQNTSIGYEKKFNMYVKAL